MDKDSILTGIVLGTIMPVIGYLIIDSLAEMATNSGLIRQVAGSILDTRMKTITLIAICFNIISVELCRKYNLNETMRGIVFPTVLYIGFWLYKFSHLLFS